jgi:hypothetical protein
MTPNRPPIPWREIRELVRYLEHEEHSAHIGNAVRTVRQWLDPKPPVDERQTTMLGKW